MKTHTMTSSRTTLHVPAVEYIGLRQPITQVFADGKPLDPRIDPRIDLRKSIRHKLVPFDWGYAGNLEPRYLALAILADQYSDHTALECSYDFMMQVIALLPRRNFSLLATDVVDWCEHHGYSSIV